MMQVAILQQLNSPSQRVSQEHVKGLDWLRRGSRDSEWDRPPPPPSETVNLETPTSRRVSWVRSLSFLCLKSPPLPKAPCTLPGGPKGVPVLLEAQPSPSLPPSGTQQGPLLSTRQVDRCTLGPPEVYPPEERRGRNPGTCGSGCRGVRPGGRDVALDQTKSDGHSCTHERFWISCLSLCKDVFII